MSKMSEPEECEVRMLDAVGKRRAAKSPPGLPSLGELFLGLHVGDHLHHPADLLLLLVELAGGVGVGAGDRALGGGRAGDVGELLGALGLGPAGRRGRGRARHGHDVAVRARVRVRVGELDVEPARGAAGAELGGLGRRLRVKVHGYRPLAHGRQAERRRRVQAEREPRAGEDRRVDVHFRLGLLGAGERRADVLGRLGRGLGRLGRGRRSGLGRRPHGRDGRRRRREAGAHLGRHARGHAGPARHGRLGRGHVVPADLGQPGRPPVLDDLDGRHDVCGRRGGGRDRGRRAGPGRRGHAHARRVCAGHLRQQPRQKVRVEHAQLEDVGVRQPGHAQLDQRLQRRLLELPRDGRRRRHRRWRVVLGRRQPLAAVGRDLGHDLGQKPRVERAVRHQVLERQPHPRQLDQRDDRGRVQRPVRRPRRLPSASISPPAGGHVPAVGLRRRRGVI
ncbi:uncharacterized protein V1510DRAFT_423763 [Dipodascopsis tothii]|uniref:uncharacterized protein n=1 Tax=Dipodascopsis tothii TaxID=44089 RepID=UPI0034CEE84A